MTTDAPLERWLERHSYLASIAKFQRLLDGGAGGQALAGLGVEAWEASSSQVGLGECLLCGVDGLPLARGAAGLLGEIAGRVGAAELPDPLARDCRALAALLGQSPEEPAHAIEWALGEAAAPAVANPGLLRLLVWTALRRHLAPVIDAFRAWPGRLEWHQGHCPTCGALPVMAQLVPGDNGRQRLLACGHCRTRWEFRRVGCPFCDHESGARVDVLEVEGEELRLDACQECRGYLKTYTGAGDEGLFLADWSTLHLDVLARQRGFTRRGESLYDLPPDA
jgi:FdhE protein